MNRRMFQLGVLAGMLLLASLAAAQCPGMTTQQVPFAKEVFTVSSTAVSLTAAVYQPAGTTASMALVTIEGGEVRYDVLGVPTAAVGHRILGTFHICGPVSIAAFKVIRIATDATLTVTYYKPKAP